MLTTVRQTFVNSIGPRATHALEAGVVLSVLVTTIQYFPEYTLLLAGIFGVEKTIKRLRKREKPISQLTLFTLLKAIVPKSHLKHIRVQPVYFIAGTVLGASGVYIAAVVTGRTVLFLPV
jgi:cobalamin biosynthesis Co2+ chelatase CbiK